MEEKTITKIAQRVRQVIEEEVNNGALSHEELVELSNFPRGSCAVASETLALYLQEVGFEPGMVTGTRVTGEGGTWNRQYHRWVVCGNLAVDITADQFPDCENPVIVSNNHPIHQSFTLDSKPSVSLDALSRPGSGGYIKFYKRIRNYLDHEE